MLVLLLKASHLATQIHPQNMFDQGAFLDTLFDDFIDFMRKLSIWGNIQNPVGANMGPQIDQAAPNI